MRPQEKEPVDLKEALQGFFNSYLLELKCASPHTIKGYRDSLKLLILFAQKQKGSPVVGLSNLTIDLVLDFLNHLEDKSDGRNNSGVTRNTRLAAIRAFFRYLAWKYPHLERLAERVSKIPLKKVHQAKRHYLTQAELKVLFAQVDTREPDGFRDLAILTFLYNTGARAQEVADARIAWFDFTSQAVTITGKGNKDRPLPLWQTTIKALTTYRDKYRRTPAAPGTDIFFINQRGKGFTRFGIHRLVGKYIDRAKTKCESLKSKNLSTHSLRHTTAMHLLDAGVDLNVIKAWLGHSDLASTSIYLQADLVHKKRALDKFAPPINVASYLEPKTQGSTEQILDWLTDI